ncbi:MAG: hypothetical protein ACUVRP_09340 [Chlorobiales bacterium]
MNQLAHNRKSKLSILSLSVVSIFLCSLIFFTQGFSPKLAAPNHSDLSFESTKAKEFHREYRSATQDSKKFLIVDLENKNTNELTALVETDEDDSHLSSFSAFHFDTVVKNKISDFSTTLLLSQSRKLYILYCSLLIHLA